MVIITDMTAVRIEKMMKVRMRGEVVAVGAVHITTPTLTKKTMHNTLPFGVINMNHEAVPAYGLWGLATLNSVIFVMFAFSFFKPKTKTDWRTFSAFSAFLIALFVEMYGFPLSIFLLSGWLSTKYPGVNFLTHDNGHLIHTLLGMKGDPHWDVFHILSNVFIFGGFIMLS